MRDQKKEQGNELKANSIMFGRLSKEQKYIVDVPLNVNLCIIAGPGSGKTSTLTTRIIRTILERKKSIVCITFTKNSAIDLKEKIMKQINGLIDIRSFDISRDQEESNNKSDEENEKEKEECTNKKKRKNISSNLFKRTQDIPNKSIIKVLNTTMFVGTIHAFCSYLLFKYKVRFKILTDTMNKNVIKLAFKNFLEIKYVKDILQKEKNKLQEGIFEDSKREENKERISNENNNNKNNNNNELIKFLSEMNTCVIKDEEIEDVLDEEDNEEDDEDYYNYVYIYKNPMEKEIFENVKIQSPLKEKNIIYLKRKIQLIKYVELYELKMEMNPIESMFFQEYRKILSKAKHVYYGYDDIIIETYRMMKQNTDIRNKILKEWHYVFCDEFQDTNITQYNILQFFANPDQSELDLYKETNSQEENSLVNTNKYIQEMKVEENEDQRKWLQIMNVETKESNEIKKTKQNQDEEGKIETYGTKKKSINYKSVHNRSLTVIGDDDQAIYSFRGATINVFNKFRKECNCLILKLGYNFRSTKEIVRVSSNLIEYNKQYRIDKNLYTENVKGEKPTFHFFKTNIDQIAYILSEIVYLKKKYNYHYTDFAILSRTNKTLKETMKLIESWEVRKQALKYFQKLKDNEKENQKTSEKKIEKTEEDDINEESFRIPMKEFNNKKQFFGSKEIIYLVTILRFFLNVHDDVLCKRAFKIIKNDKISREIIKKISSNQFEKKLAGIPTKNKKVTELSFYDKIKIIAHMYMCKINKIKNEELSKGNIETVLELFNQRELLNLIDFFFYIKHFIEFCSQLNSVYNLVIEIMRKINFTVALFAKIEKRLIQEQNEKNKLLCLQKKKNLDQLQEGSSLSTIPEVLDIEKPNKKKRTYEERNEKEMEQQTPLETSVYNIHVMNETKIRNDLKKHFNVKEEDMKHVEFQNIFTFLEMTMEYKPNSLQQTCSDCLSCFLSDFKNNIHENLLVEKVALSTIHKAKGLEWKIVFIINMVEGEIPQLAENKSQMFEERKILYVGITRAKAFLYLLGYVTGDDHVEQNTVSRFINQLHI